MWKSQFPDQYAIYRPTLYKGSGYEQTINVPTSATYSAEYCRFFPNPSPLTVNGFGIDQDIDAVLLTPNNAPLRPEGNDQEPDIVEYDGTRYTVRAVHKASGQTFYKKAALRED